MVLTIKQLNLVSLGGLNREIVLPFPAAIVSIRRNVEKKSHDLVKVHNLNGFWNKSRFEIWTPGKPGSFSSFFICQTIVARGRVKNRILHSGDRVQWALEHKEVLVPAQIWKISKWIQRHSWWPRECFAHLVTY